MVESETLKLLNHSFVSLFVVNVNTSQFEVQGRDEREEVDHVALRMSSGTFSVVVFLLSSEHFHFPKSYDLVTQRCWFDQIF